ncbi:MAG: DUF169 domain-containing protein [Candidatus Acetothermia bacterium]
METHQTYGKELEDRLRLDNFPIGLKLLNDKEDIPDTARRPLKDMGHHLSLCQAFEKARRDGETIAMLKEDNWCFEPLVGYGLGKPPDYFLEGHNRYPHDVKSLEAGSNYAEEFPKLDPGQFVGLVFAPLTKANFNVDISIIYCNAEQLSLLLLGREYEDGRNLKLSLSSHAACVYAAVPAIKNGRCQVAIPCRGDHYSAMAQSDEIIFSIPDNKLESVMEGLRHVAKTGSKLPRSYRTNPEYPLSDSYRKIAEMMGYL